ncbi:hypothetical protein KDL01_36590 [Actinospica durhamensis]|uniref:Uncharacterized protein n=1 Tax=Actinospica durhamensis TaxID=1508375 RepID=A0A941IV94_9ACTN|nr:hypothetical protein [Actinospica durhamensis]MBR7838843.1 hypothetical protein [Actinospica durhamensis]
MTDADPLVRPLAEIVVELAWMLESSIDEDGEPRGAIKTLDWVAGVFDCLTADQRLRLIEVIAGIAAEAELGPRREFLEAFASDFGLAEEDDE